MDSKLFARYIVREIMGLVIIGVALFWPAGRLDWWAAWAALFAMTVWVAGTTVVIMRINPDLLAERLGPRQDAKRWDTVIMSMVGLIQLARYIVAGLDQRLGWTGGFSLTVQVMAFTVCLFGNILVVWATASNAYFSQIVRIQSEREHAVAAGGPYRYVRHPAYVGSILYDLAVPILLASWWALAISSLGVILFILRTALEDRTLRAELTGYDDYAHKVRYRLLPGVW